MRLDESLPYGEVIGIQGARFLQDGRLFSSDGREMRQVSDELAEMIPGDDPEIPKPSNTDHDKMHWRTLKALVEQFGGEWTNKEDALRFLAGTA